MLLTDLAQSAVSALATSVAEPTQALLLSPELRDLHLALANGLAQMGALPLLGAAGLLVLRRIARR